MAAKRLGEYELVRELGRGGMGVVYEARDPVLDRTVALKILPRKLAVDASYVTRFLNEARAAARLNHPNIVIVHAIGEADGRRYIAMERVRGQVLSKFVKTGRPMPAGQALRLVRQVADALAAAHSQGIVHRDIKPQNIMVDEAGAVKVLDFGLARLQGSGAGLTTTGAQLGTPRYMSPEQAQGKKADERSDIYSLGVVLYELLAGRPAYDGDSPVAIMYQIVHEPFPSLAAVDINVPPPIAALVQKMVAKRPEDRYQTAASVMTDIDAVQARGTMQVYAPVSRAIIEPRAPSVILDDSLREEIVGRTTQYPTPRPRPRRKIKWPRFSLKRLIQFVPARQKIRHVSRGAGAAAVIAIIFFSARFVGDNKEVIVVLPGGIEMKFVWVPRGEFVMGSPESEAQGGEGGREVEMPQHEVTISNGFWMSATEVTDSQWDALMRDVHRGVLSDFPVTGVSWNDCQTFVSRFNELEGSRIRLPTEAEWEYACRAGRAAAFSFGSDEREFGDFGWYDRNSGGSKHPVAQKRPNAWGLYDLHGNVWEWVQDWYSEYSEMSALDPAGPQSGSERVMRGGSYPDSPGGCRSAHRHRWSPDGRFDTVGFRVAASSDDLVESDGRVIVTLSRQEALGLLTFGISEVTEDRNAAEANGRPLDGIEYRVGIRVGRMGILPGDGFVKVGKRQITGYDALIDAFEEERDAIEAGAANETIYELNRDSKRYFIVARVTD